MILRIAPENHVTITPNDIEKWSQIIDGVSVGIDVEDDVVGATPVECV